MPRVFAVVTMVLNILYVLFLEEPESKRRFGQSYFTYMKEVPGWLPRLRPYEGELEPIEPNTRSTSR